MIKLKFCLVIFFFFSSFTELIAQQSSGDLEGKVIGVKDGDTIELLFDGSSIVVRLAHIDCPEIKKKQPYGTAAKKYTADFCFGKMVRVENDGKYDRNHRLIGVVYNEDGINLNRQLVKAGLAWHFKKYSTDKVYAQLEMDARKSKIGLWSDNNPVPPWEWRKPKKPKA